MEGFIPPSQDGRFKRIPLMIISTKFSCLGYMKQRVQGLQVFPFYVVKFNDEHAKPTFKRRHRG